VVRNVIEVAGEIVLHLSSVEYLKRAEVSILLELLSLLLVESRRKKAQYP